MEGMAYSLVQICFYHVNLSRYIHMGFETHFTLSEDLLLLAPVDQLPKI
jgi:hypothetical protein